MNNICKYCGYDHETWGNRAAECDKKRLEELQAQLAEYRWIPVAEPPKKKCFINIREIKSQATDCFYYNGSLKTWEWLVVNKNYTHWMPIPQLPENDILMLGSSGKNGENDAIQKT